MIELLTSSTPYYSLPSHSFVCYFVLQYYRVCNYQYCPPFPALTLFHSAISTAVILYGKLSDKYIVSVNNNS